MWEFHELSGETYTNPNWKASCMCVYIHAVNFIKKNTKFQYLSTIANDDTQKKKINILFLYIFFTEIGTNNRQNKHNFFCSCFMSFSFPSLATTTTTTLTSLNCHTKHIDDNDYGLYSYIVNAISAINNEWMDIFKHKQHQKIFAIFF